MVPIDVKGSYVGIIYPFTIENMFTIEDIKIH